MMIQSHARLPQNCPYPHCKQYGESPKTRRFVRKGFYKRSSDRRVIPRFICLECKRSFSSASFEAEKGQIRRDLNQRIQLLYVSGSASLRRIAWMLHTTRATIAQKLIFLGLKNKLKLRSSLLSQQAQGLFTEIYFDEMESSERSKCLPVSILLVVNQDRRIIGVRVCSMPAKGPLAALSRKKYGLRKDERNEAADSLFKELKPFLSPHVVIKTDENPRYPAWIRSHFPQAEHRTFKGRRGCVVGQGELKEGGWDPLFVFNHTAAMIRANVNRLFRRTWCISKLKERLEDHLYLYINFHNDILLKNPAKQH